MRKLMFLLLVVCLGTVSQAQEQSLSFKVRPLTMPMAPILEQSALQIQMIRTAASFYKEKHGRIKRALLFRPMTSRTQVA